MTVITGRLTRKSFDDPDELRPFEGKGHLDVVNLEGVVGRGVFEPGWRWSTNVKPIAGTDSCMAPHAGYVVSGRLHVAMDNGDEQDFGPGDLMLCPPGHDAWTLGDEPCVMIDWTGYGEYAKKH
jgi:hypothetical protein